MESFTTKEKIKISKDKYEFFTRFRVIKGLNFPIILGMDWWCRNQPVVNLAEKQVAVTLGGKVATLPLVRSPELVSGLQQLNIVDDVNLISSCEKEVAENQGNGFIAALLTKFAALFNPIAPPKVPQNLFFKIDFKPDANKCFGSPVYSLDILKLKYLKEYIDSKLKEGVIVPSKSSLVSPVILVPKSSGELRVCVDYRRLNDITETDNYPLPLLDDIISSISGSKN